jgi:hypothetical protein
MEIHDSKGEYVEIFIGILITSNLSLKISEDNIQDPIGVIAIDYIDDNEPFEELGKRMLDNGFDEDGELILNTTKICVLKYDNIYYIITRKLQSTNKKERSNNYLYTITPKRQFNK